MTLSAAAVVHRRLVAHITVYFDTSFAAAAICFIVLNVSGETFDCTIFTTSF